MLSKIKSIFSRASSFFKQNKKLTIICLVALLCSFFALTICSNQVVTRDAEFSKTTQVSPYTTNGYAVSGNIYTPVNSDPQMYIYGISASINDVSVKLSSPLTEDTECQVFYANDELGLSEANSVSFFAYEGTSEIYFTVPELTYTLIRIDINGEFELDSIQFATATKSVSALTTRINYPLFIALLIIISACLVFYFLYSEKIDSSVLKIKGALFSTELDEGFLRSSAKRTANTYAIIAFFVGIMLAFIMPPLSVADEQAHFLNVLRVSHFDLPTVHGGSLGAFLTVDEASFLRNFNSPQSIHMSWSGLFGGSATSQFQTQFFASDFVTLNSFAYLVPGIAVAIARAMFEDIDVYSLLIIARLANLVLGIIMVRHAIKITPAFRNTIFLLALMPMTLHQCASTSYDALLICACFLLFAYIMKLLLSDKDYKISIKDIIIICLCLCVIFAAKIAYAIVIILFLAVSFKKFGNWKKYVLCIGLVGVCAGLFYFLPTLLSSYAISSAQSAVAASASATSNEFVLNLDSINNIVESTINHFEDDWRGQFFGVLGWLKIDLPMAFAELFYIVLSLVVITDACQIKGLNIRARALSYLSFYIFSIVLIVNAFLVWNPSVNISGTWIAYGIQGRYFIPIIIFAFALISNPLLTKFKYRKQIVGVSYGVISITGIVCAMLTLFAITAFYWF